MDNLLRKGMAVTALPIMCAQRASRLSEIIRKSPCALRVNKK